MRDVFCIEWNGKEIRYGIEVELSGVKYRTVYRPERLQFKPRQDRTK